MSDAQIFGDSELFSGLEEEALGLAAQEADHDDENHNVIPGAWRDQMDWLDVDQPPAPSNSARAKAKHQRELLKAFFNSPQGVVAWQNRMAGLHDAEGGEDDI
ncbi:hypothetical protein NHX12_009267 [Muraenolepis orangiensis]|uniref:Uncharacterized protein n=1 Tax=Muraenolepis orangiensis TaxID=630683 RepID=A0A9Q0DN29_9TELE|nr:hypothetical protein NHX12_009267 [Muraenolepis orangiensis]